MNLVVSPALQPPASLQSILEASWSQTAQELGLVETLTRFAQDGAKRDVERRLLFPEIAEVKAFRLGAARLPKHLGGHGLTLPQLFLLARDIATADSNLAHVLRNHFHAVERHLRTPDDPFSHKFLELVAGGAILGGAYSEKGAGPAGAIGGTGTTLKKVAGGYVLNGVKAYSTGNLYSDYLFVSAVWADTGEPQQIFIPRHRKGVRIEDDWEGFGQKLTGSGSTHFRDVTVSEEDLVPQDEQTARYPGHYQFTFPQLFLTTVISGIMQRIFADAVVLTASRSRNYYHAQAASIAAEPAVQSVIGQIAAHTHAIAAVVDRAAGKLDHAWQKRDDAEGKRFSLDATIAAAEAKVVAEEAATRLAGSLIDLASGSSVSLERALDRHWRNIKVISSHNPRIYKERVLGDYYLNGTTPPTGPFF